MIVLPENFQTVLSIKEDVLYSDPHPAPAYQARHWGGSAVQRQFSKVRASIANLRQELLRTCRATTPIRSIAQLADFADGVAAADNFGFSLRGMLLYAQFGTTDHREMGHREEGLFLSGKDFAFGLGLYERDGLYAAHVIAPQGKSWPSAVNKLSLWLFQHGIDRVYVRHLPVEHAKLLPAEIYADPRVRYGWCAEAPLEDETFHHRMINLEEVIDVQPGRLRIRNIAVPGSHNFRSKFRHAYSRFENFLTRAGLQFDLVPISSLDHQHAAEELVASHFQHLDQSGRLVGSTALDYQQLLKSAQSPGKRYISLLGCLSRDEGKSLPVSVFLGEQLGPSTGGLYCTISNRDSMGAMNTFGLLDDQGYSALGQYAYARLFAAVRELGWRNVDLGGSETPELDSFKQQLGCREFATAWRVITSAQYAALSEYCDMQPSTNAVLFS